MFSPFKSAREKSISRDHLELIHWLNQCYKQEWLRAEDLQAQLNTIRNTKIWRFLRWLRKMTRGTKSLPETPSLNFTYSTESCESYRVPPLGSVSLIIPFKDRLALLRDLLQSLSGSTYRRFEILLVDNGSTCPRMGKYLEKLKGKKRIRVINDPEPFNFSRLCNFGAQHARGDYLLFMNNDMEVLTPDWLEQLLELAGHPQIGVVGATLLYPDGTLQHAGIAPQSETQWVHVYRGLPADFPGERGELLEVRSVPAVTGACLLIRKKLFQNLGGFREDLPVTYNDVDLCCRARREGFLVAITPHARLLHFESLSRGYSLDDVEALINPWSREG